MRIVGSDIDGYYRLEDETGEPMGVGLFDTEQAARRFAKAEGWSVVDQAAPPTGEQLALETRP